MPNSDRVFSLKGQPVRDGVTLRCTPDREQWVVLEENASHTRSLSHSSPRKMQWISSRLQISLTRSRRRLQWTPCRGLLSPVGRECFRQLQNHLQSRSEVKNPAARPVFRMLRANRGAKVM